MVGNEPSQRKCFASPSGSARPLTPALGRARQGNRRCPHAKGSGVFFGHGLCRENQPLPEKDSRPRVNRPVRSGAILAMVLVCLLVASMLGIALVERVVMRHRQMTVVAQRQQCFWLAESGAQRALQRLAKSPDYPGETWVVPAQVLGGTQSGAVTIQVTKATEPRVGQRIVVEARFPDDPIRRTVCQRELFVKQP
jgi:hypothetical protein